MDRYQLEVMRDRTVVLHDTQAGTVLDAFAGWTAMLDALAAKARRESALCDETNWEWIK